MRMLFPVILFAFFVLGCGQGKKTDQSSANWYHGDSSYVLPGESHFKSMMMLTNGGENAEAYWNWTDNQFIFQSTRDSLKCDQIFIMNADGSNVHEISNGKGRTTCAYFFPGNKRILYSSTFLAGPDCPPTPDYSRGYVWGVYKSYDIFTANPDGSDLRQLTSTPGYDAEATIGANGRIVFTSARSGDLEIYTMDSNGNDLKRITHEQGYDGGPFFSPDEKKIVYRGYHPTDPAELQDYQQLLKDGWVRPTVMEIYICNADGSEKQQLTHNGAANFAPYFHPSGKKIIFASNMNDPQGRNFDLYVMNLDGSGLEQITFNDSFDAFPMFSNDGKYLAFSSNRFGKKEGDTNVFVAEWVD